MTPSDNPQPAEQPQGHDHDHDHGPLWSASQAAQRTGISRATMTRRLQAGQIPGATKDSQGSWQITPEALKAAGLDPDAGAARIAPSAAGTEVSELRAALAAEQQRRAVAEALAAERAQQVSHLQELLERLTTGMGMNMATGTRQAASQPAQAPRTARKAPPPRATTADTPAGQRILQLRDAGHQFSEIATILTDEGIPTTTGKTTWHRSTVNRIYNRLADDQEQATDSPDTERPAQETGEQD